jgi:tetratricopeptide (TPR) repeat protein
MKDKLRLLIKAGREKEAQDLLPHVDDSPPSRPGGWTAKDNLAHLATWRLVGAVEMDAVRTGGKGPVVSSDAAVENAKIYEETHHLPASSVLDTAARSWDAFIAAMEACSDEVLLQPRIRYPEEALWHMVPGHTYFHLAEHLGYWHTDRGEEVAAEEAAKWGHRLATSTDTEDKATGTADYNLGCFYAVRGRLEEAMPYLRTAIELNPSLRDWAKQDKDLDPIRATSELTRLLA